MKIILSPTRKMKHNTDDFLPKTEVMFKEEARELLKYLQNLPNKELNEVWGCKEKLFYEAKDMIMASDIDKNLSPALFTYQGIAFQSMNPMLMTEDELKYIEEHLVILSGMYGIVKPFDGICQYRLEMKSKINFKGNKTLYSYWGEKIAKELEDDFILDLASKEYSQLITKYRKDNILTCLFGEIKNNKVVQKATLSKILRGEMVKFCGKNKIENKEKLKEFSERGYVFNNEISTDNIYVFSPN